MGLYCWSPSLAASMASGLILVLLIVLDQGWEGRRKKAMECSG